MADPVAATAIAADAAATAPKDDQAAKEVEETDPAPAAKRARPANEFTLFSYWRSSASWRVRIALNLKGKSFDYVPVNLLKGEQRSDEHCARNPMCVVPALKTKRSSGDGDVVITQSLPIIEYLDTRIPEPPLLPPVDQPEDRATVRALAEMINSGVQPVQNLYVLKHVGELLGDDAKGPWAKWAITHGLAGFERAIAKTAGKYCFGDTVTLPDLCLVPQMFNARRFGVDLTQFPTATRVEAELVKLPAFEAAVPEKQPDAVAA
eukprot:TRINITY_DN33492_c0_g1_i1.p1 TRINITY_DN33492_c0_g1~~TRINITY_DN33492_c0_g1_i1.p1  ORF type:complete len:272 (-),score=63.20 TRINITY_DN33492_c0_g1_i1:249-1040(-)